jgi:hypothetical protein
MSNQNDKPTVEEIMEALFGNIPQETPPTDRYGMEVVRVSSTIPADVADDIDAIAQSEGLYRSQVIRRAITGYIGSHYG